MAVHYCCPFSHVTVSPLCLQTGVALGQYSCSNSGHSMYASGQPGLFAVGSQYTPTGLLAHKDAGFGLHSMTPGDSCSH